MLLCKHEVIQGRNFVYLTDVISSWSDSRAPRKSVIMGIQGPQWLDVLAAYMPFFNPKLICLDKAVEEWRVMPY